MDALCVFCVCVYSGYAFMLSIQAIHSCYLFRQFIHAIYSGNSFMLSIQAIHSCYLFRLFIQAIYSGYPFRTHKLRVQAKIWVFSSFRTHKLRVQAKFWLFTKIFFFKDRLKRCFDNGFVIYAKFRVDLYPGFIQRCFLRRVMAEQR